MFPMLNYLFDAQRKSTVRRNYSFLSSIYPEQNTLYLIIATTDKKLLPQPAIKIFSCSISFHPRADKAEHYYLWKI
jgi:hypothetical protein